MVSDKVTILHRHKLTYISTLYDVKRMTLLNTAGKFKEVTVSLWFHIGRAQQSP